VGPLDSVDFAGQRLFGVLAQYPATDGVVRDLAGLAGDPSLAAIVLVTHHLEEVPPGFSHALLLRAGRAVAAGPIDEALTGTTLSSAFGLPIRVDQQDGRRWARAAG
jgi:iron complex transport system ATP-binding protein